jgi:hypothetical protein
LKVRDEKTMGEIIPEELPYGTLRITLLPKTAAAAGAQWRIDGETWWNSGVEITNIAPGRHTISYKPVVGCHEPGDESFIVLGDDYFYLTRYYNIGIGSLKINLSPPEAVAAGAQWRVDAGAWQNSGAIVSNLSAFSHIVEYKALDEWAGPISEYILITEGETIELFRAYTETISEDRITCLYSLDPQTYTWAVIHRPTFPGPYYNGCLIEIFSLYFPEFNGTYTAAIVSKNEDCITFHLTEKICSSFTPTCACDSADYGTLSFVS